MIKTDVARNFVEVKFAVALKVSSISNDDFTLYKVSDTPIGEPFEGESSLLPIADPFKPIVIKDHYSSIRRTLKLYFKQPMDSGIYELRANEFTYEDEENGLQDSAGRVLSPTDGTWELHYLHCRFDYNYTTTVPDESTDEDDWWLKDNDPYERPPVVIEDHSIAKNITIGGGETIYTSNPDFHIVRTEPENGSIFVEDDKQGRISIIFSTRPSTRYINDDFIKVQRKKLGVGLNRWEPVDAKFTLEVDRPRLNIYLPSNDEESVYQTEGYQYLLPNHKYRVRLSGDIAAKGSS